MVLFEGVTHRRMCRNICTALEISLHSHDHVHAYVYNCNSKLSHISSATLKNELRVRIIRLYTINTQETIMHTCTYLCAYV